MIVQCRILFTNWCPIFKKVSFLDDFHDLSFNSCSFYIDEITREREFYKARNLPCPKDVPQENKETEDMETKLNEAHQESDYHRIDEQVNLCLECSTSSNLKNLKRRFIRCSSQATITQLKKFVAKKVLNGIEKYREVSYDEIHWRWQRGSQTFNFRLTYYVMMSCSGRITHWSSFTLLAGALRTHRLDFNIDRRSLTCERLTRR